MKQIIQRIKSGEYDGKDLMLLWSAVENLTNINHRQEELINSLYKGLGDYYTYSNSLEDSIYSLGDEVASKVFLKMSMHCEDIDSFNHKDCRFLLSEVEHHLKSI